METSKVFVIGDSISIHYGPYLEIFLKSRFRYARKEGSADALENLDIPRGANGGDSTMVLDYLQTASVHGEIGNPDIMLLNCGLHDIKTDTNSGKCQVEPDAYCENLENIVQTAKHICRRITWIRTTPCDEEIHNSRQKHFYRFQKDCIEYNRIADDIMMRHSIPVIDLYGFTQKLGVPREIYVDHIHFTPAIRQLQAAFIAGWLNQGLPANENPKKSFTL